MLTFARRPARRPEKRAAVAAVAASAALLAACGTTQLPPERSATAGPCPPDLPGGTQCWSGQDTAGAHYLIVRPADWNGTLVLHAHGGPALGPPKADRVAADLKRCSVAVKAGYAWAGTSFHQGGVAVRAAAEDVERLRGIAQQTARQAEDHDPA